MARILVVVWAIWLHHNEVAFKGWMVSADEVEHIGGGGGLFQIGVEGGVGWEGGQHKHTCIYI